MSKTAYEIRMEKLRNWEIQEMANRHEAKKAWWRCGISLGAGLLLYPVLCRPGLLEMWGIVFTICGLVFIYSVVEILQLEERQRQHDIEMDLLTKLEGHDV